MEGTPGVRHGQVPEGRTGHTFRGLHFLPSGLALPLRFLRYSFEFTHGSLWERGTKVVGAYVRSLCVVRDLKLFKKKMYNHEFLPVRYRLEKTRFYGFGR